MSASSSIQYLAALLVIAIISTSTVQASAPSQRLRSIDSPLSSPTPFLTQGVCNETAGSYCLPARINKLARVVCEPGFYCPGNVSAVVCPEGYYCPTATTLVKCPADHYCPKASTEPTQCSPFAYCPEGSSRFIHLGALFLCVLIFPAIFAFQKYFYLRRYAAKQAEARSFKQVHVMASSSSDEIDTLATSDAPSTKLPDPAAVPQPSQHAPLPMDLQFDGLVSTLTLKGNEKKTILNNVSGEFKSGQVSCILGPSGSGKTSLMSVLTGKVPYQTGTIRINGTVDRIEAYQPIVGFVPQDDIMIRTLTVREILEHSARTRLPRSWTEQQRQERVDEVLKALHITHMQHSVIGDENVRGVSGGERKRVSVGIELVANPSVLFLDEPITGLDSTTGLDVIRQLRKIARNSHVNVVAVLHQPRYEIFSLIDRILLLAPGGRTVFFGPANETLAYFESIGYPCPKNVNPTDWFLDVLSGKYPPLIEVDQSGSLQRAVSGRFELQLPEQTKPPSAAQKQERIDRIVSFWEKRQQATRKESQGALLAPEEKPSNPAAAVLPTPTHKSQESISESSSNGSDGGAHANVPSTPQVKVAFAEKHCLFCNTFLAPAGVECSKCGLVNSNKPLKQLASSSGASFLTQIGLSAWRGLLIHYRTLPGLTVELLMHVLAGLVLGIAFVSDFTFLPPLPPTYIQYCPEPFQDNCKNRPLREHIGLLVSYSTMAVGLTASVIATRNFGPELTNIYREARSGASTVAYIIGKCLSDLPTITVYSFFYCLAFYVVVAPTAPFNQFFACHFLFEFTLFGMGYACSLWLDDQELARLTATVAALLGGLGSDKRAVSKLACWGSWFSEALWIAESRYSDRPAQTQGFIAAYAKVAQGFEMDKYASDLVILFIYGLALRALATSFLLYKKRARKF